MPDQGSKSGVTSSPRAPNIKGMQRKLNEARAARVTAARNKAATPPRLRPDPTTPLPAPSEMEPTGFLRWVIQWVQSARPMSQNKGAYVRLLMRRWLFVVKTWRDLLTKRPLPAVSALHSLRKNSFAAVISLCAAFLVFGFLLGHQSDDPDLTQLLENGDAAQHPRVVGKFATAERFEPDLDSLDTELSRAELTSAPLALDPNAPSPRPQVFALPVALEAPASVTAHGFDSARMVASTASPSVAQALQRIQPLAPLLDAAPFPVGAGALPLVKVFAPGSVTEETLQDALKSLRSASREVPNVERVAFTISTPHVRYYSADDREMAAELAERMSVDLRNFEHVTNDTPGAIEYWMSGRAAAQP